MKKISVMLFSICSLFLIGTSGVKADTICSTVEECETIYNEQVKYAVKTTSLYDDTDITDNELSYFVIVFNETTTSMNVVWSNKELQYNDESGGNHSFYTLSNDTKAKYYTVVLDENNKVKFTSLSSLASVSYSGNRIGNYYISEFYGSSYDVLSKKTGEVFFKPQAQIFPELTVATFQPILKTILGLVSLVIFLVVLLVGFYKGFRMLLRALQKA